MVSAIERDLDMTQEAHCDLLGINVCLAETKGNGLSPNHMWFAKTSPQKVMVLPKQSQAHQRIFKSHQDVLPIHEGGGIKVKERRWTLRARYDSCR